MAGVLTDPPGESTVVVNLRYSIGLYFRNILLEAAEPEHPETILRRISNASQNRWFPGSIELCCPSVRADVTGANFIRLGTGR